MLFGFILPWGIGSTFVILFSSVEQRTNIGQKVRWSRAELEQAYWSQKEVRLGSKDKRDLENKNERLRVFKSIIKLTVIDIE